MEEEYLEYLSVVESCCLMWTDGSWCCVVNIMDVDGYNRGEIGNRIGRYIECRVYNVLVMEWNW